MTRLLPDVLQPGAGRLPEAMLRSLVLDGALVPIGGAYRPVDIPPTPEVRAAAISSRIPHGSAPALMVVAGRAAAWIWGALPRLEDPLTVIVRSEGRMPAVDQPGVRLHRIALLDEDVVALAGLLVTSASRTAIDLLRGDDAEAEAGGRLVRERGLAPAEILASIAGRRRLPGRRRALARAQLLLTR